MNTSTLQSIGLLAADFTEVGENVAPHVAFTIGGIAIYESVVWGFAVTGILIVFALIVRFLLLPRFKMIAGGFQAVIEYFVSFFDNMSKDGGPTAAFLGPYVFGTGCFIFFGTMIEMIGIRSPIADINTCLALSLMTFFLINFFAFKYKGPVGRVKYYLQPAWFAAPFRLMSDLMVPVSMAFRLFASVLSGLIAMEIVYVMLPYVLPAALSLMFTVFDAVVQAYVYTLLTVTFINEAIE